MPHLLMSLWIILSFAEWSCFWFHRPLLIPLLYLLVVELLLSYHLLVLGIILRGLPVKIHWLDKLVLLHILFVFSSVRALFLILIFIKEFFFIILAILYFHYDWWIVCVRFFNTWGLLFFSLIWVILTLCWLLIRQGMFFLENLFRLLWS
jgi:hypothetical protein